MTGKEINLLALWVANGAFDVLNCSELEDFMCLLAQVQCNLATLNRKRKK